MWNGIRDDKRCACPVQGSIVERAKGRLELRLNGWSPAAAWVRVSLLDEPGSRKITPVEGPGARREDSLIFVAVLIGTPPAQAVAGPGRADQDPTEDGKKQAPMDARTLLKKGQVSGALPEGMVVRLGACLGAADEGAGGHVPKELKEMWEFTPNQVHRVVIESKEGKLSYHQVESRPFDSKGICKDLLEGKAIDIQARKGTGPQVAFVGTIYHSFRFAPHRSGVARKNNPGPTRKPRCRCRSLSETDARAFGALYERLASQARVLFKSKAAEAK